MFDFGNQNRNPGQGIGGFAPAASPSMFSGNAATTTTPLFGGGGTGTNGVFSSSTTDNTMTLSLNHSQQQYPFGANTPPPMHPHSGQLLPGGSSAMTTPFAGNNNSSSGGSLMFGSSPNNMTTAVAPHHPAGGFSGINNNNAGTMMFGQSSSIGGFGSTQNNNNNNLESLPFGGSSQANMSNTAIHNTPFGNSNNNSNSRSNAPFGGQSFQQQQTPLFGGPAVGTTPSTTATSNNPFANPFAQNQEHVQQSTMPQSMSFGQSTNIIASNTNPTSTSSSTQFGGGWPISQSRSSDTSSRPFGDSTDTFPGSTSSGLAPFGLSASNDDGMMDDVPEPSLSNLLFGQPAFSTTKTGHATGMGDTNTTGSRMFGRPDTVVVDDLPGNNNNEALLRLQSKIEAKKKKLAEQKQMREATVAAASSLRPDAAPFQPPSSNHPGMPSQGAPSQTELRGSVSAATDSDSEALQNVAQRNAIRFADSVDTGTRSQLPTDLLSLSADATAVQTALRNAGGRSARENLENAVSLVGTCEHMCPDEELLRREREGDIQLLERPIPDGIFHPKSWTLRNTMVKRFRRSAADYKLDVPEWVRPPDVLERVCSYLEEWVMERDRQGVDPRYAIQPPPLDVYQYVWDRTRMVRKDFILQNYVGSGGMCDARAVRCHERIARWHCMCEHQLSHLNDFVVMQSQQNVQELGQTMKTLNQFYDDSLGRAFVEVSDDQGRETRPDLSDLGCCDASIVQGTPPIDYDGSALYNTDDDGANRLIGKNLHLDKNHGTSEPEMRGLYILLTMDNDGGMEVLKYAARLYQERPKVYNTHPVQLAISIFKAKTDLNYARFFSILRSASTPYLTACLMFKHVEAMRKAAFRICNRAYGGKNREEEAIHDSYPLQRLTALLCFESDDETRSSCRHYNITVVNDGNGREFISWKGSSFREPKDPDKGTVIYLRPQKMIRTIERKLKGATRLAVCRGEYSGNVSHLPGVVGRDRQDTKTTSTNESIDNAIFQQTLKENEAKRKQLLDRQRHAEVEAQHEKEIEQRKAAQLEREMIEAKIQLKKRQQLEEVERREKERIEQERIEQEREVRRKLAQALEKKKAEEEESRRKEYLRQEERRMQELEKRKRQEEEQRLINEAEKIRQQQQYEAELRRLEILEQKEQQRLEAEARQLREKLCKRVTDAKKTLIWRRMEYKTLRVTSSDQTKNTVSALKSKRLLRNESLFTISISPQSIATAVNRANQVNLMKSLEYILLHRQVDGRLNELFASMVRSAIEEARHFPALKSSINRKTCLFKVCIVFPTPRSRFEQCQCDLVRAWITSHVDIGRVTSCCSGLLDVRVVFVENSAMYDTSSDTTLFIIPPSWSDLANDRMAELSALAEGVNDNVPRVVLSLSECFDSISRQAMTEKLSTIFSGGFKGVEVVGNDDLSVSTLEHILLCSFDRLATALANKNPRCVERISIGRIYYNCLSEEMWKDSSRDGTDDVLGQVMKSIDAVVDNVDNISVDLLRDEAIWPSCEFLSNKQEASFVIDYFGESACLPSNWSAVSLRRHLEPELKRYHGFFEGPYTSTVERLVSDAPDDVKWQCTSLLENNFTKASLQTAWLWRVEADESSPSCQFVYLPVGRINSIFSAACSTTGSPEVSQTRNESSYTYTWCPQELDAETTIVEYSEKSDDDVLARRSNPNEQIPVMGKRNSIRPDTSFCIPSQRCLALLPVDVVRTTGDKKRRKKRRASSQGPFSDALVESVCFTRMLEKLVCDDELEKLLHEHGGP